MYHAFPFQDHLTADGFVWLVFSKMVTGLGFGTIIATSYKLKDISNKWYLA